MNSSTSKILIVVAIVVCSSSLAAQDFDRMPPDSMCIVLQAMIDQGEELFWHQTWQAIDSASRVFDSTRVLAGRYFGKADTLYLNSQGWLARCHYMQGDMDISDSLVTDVAQICDNYYGHDNLISVAHSWPLSVLHWVQGRDDLAIPECLRALRILENAPEYLDQYVEALDALSLFYVNQNRWHEADSLDHLQLQLNQKLYGPDSWQVAFSYLSLGSSSYRAGKLAEAEKSVLKAQYILSHYSNRLADCEIYSLLGRICQKRGDLVEAERLMREQLRIAEEALGPKSWLLPYYYRELLTVLSKTATTPEDWKEIELLANRAASMCTPYWLVRYRWLQVLRCVAFATNGQYDKSLAAFNEMVEARRELTNRSFSYASESMKLHLSGIHPTIVPAFISFAEFDPTPESKRDALLMVLKGRARVLDAVAAERTFAFCSEDNKVVRLRDQLADVSEKMSSLFLAGGNQSYITRVKDSIASLQNLRERLETELSERCSGFREQKESESFSVSDVARVLPEASVLLEYIKYYPYSFQTTSYSKNYGDLAYGVFVMDHAANVNFVRLGEAALIDSLVTVCRDNVQNAAMAISNGDEAAVSEELSRASKELYNIVFAPVEEFLAGDTEVIICPESQLNLIPFEILTTADNQYMIEKYAISYLSSGRDLLKYANLPAAENKTATVIADPDYENAASRESGTLFAGLETDLSRLPTRGSDDRTECLTNLFGPLPATATEGREIANLLADVGDYDVKSFYGADATEQVLKNKKNSPGVLHLATHGYFCPESAFSGGAILDNPLLYSGLALAGANETITHENGDSGHAGIDDGILTSLEVSALNLSQTDLVVLSSCNSGLGELQYAEGVYGLKRAFQLAGAHSIIMSLMPVPDQATNELMRQFYVNWLRGLKKSAALRQASLKMLEERRREYGVAHPIFWGGFILAGDPN